jgi:hypothetical protein
VRGMRYGGTWGGGGRDRGGGDGPIVVQAVVFGPVGPYRPYGPNGPYWSYGPYGTYAPAVRPLDLLYTGSHYTPVARILGTQKTNSFLVLFLHFFGGGWPCNDRRTDGPPIPSQSITERGSPVASSFCLSRAKLIRYRSHVQGG